MSAEDLPNVRPIDWVKAFRKYLECISGPEHEQLVLDGMPEPPASLAYRATMLLVWTWASAKTGGDIRAAYSTMARILGLDERTVRRAMKSGREQGWLARTAGGNNRKPATHHLAIPSWFVEDTSVRCETNQFPVDNQVVADMGVPSDKSRAGHGMKSYRTWDEVVPDMG